MDLSSIRIGTGIQLMMRTLPILLIRFGASLLFFVVAVVYLAIAFGVSALVASAVEFLGVILFIVALVGVVPLYNLAYRYVFYMIKAAHIAIIAEILTKGDLPEGINQLEYGRKRVTERFGEVNTMFVIDELVEAVVRAFTRTVYRVTWFLPGESLDTLVRLMNRIVEFAMRYIDEAILARSFWHTEQNPWANARDGVTLYAQSWKPILMNAVALMILSYVPAVFAFIIFAAPIGFLLSIISPALAGWTIIFALLFAFLVKVAVGDAFAMAVIVSAYHRETQDLTPNPEMVQKLDSVSDKFREITEKAKRGFQSEQPETTPQPSDPATQKPPATDTPPSS